MPDLMKERRSGWAVLAVCALIASLLAAGVNPATAVEETADHLAATSACAGEAETDHMFTDVPEGHIFRDAINCIAHHGITVGTGDGTTFSPNQDVTRWQMALFIARAMKAAGLDLGAVMDAGFTDIGDAPAVSRDAINQLATNGVIAEAGTYRPNDPTTRADMAILLVGFLDKAAPNVTITEDGAIMLGTGSAAAEADDHFADVRALSPPSVDRAAAALFELGVTTGTAQAAAVVDPTRTPLDVNYDPQRTVTRGAMAAFITRALAHTSLAPATTTADPTTADPTTAEPTTAEPSGPSGPSLTGESNDRVIEPEINRVIEPESNDRVIEPEINRVIEPEIDRQGPAVDACGNSGGTRPQRGSATMPRAPTLIVTRDELGMKLTWQVDTRGSTGYADHFRVRWAPAPGNPHVAEEAVVTTTGNSCRIATSRLGPGVWTVAVAGVNSVGVGDEEERRFEGTTPSPPSWTSATQQGSATVVWSWRSSQDPGTGPVTGYRLWWIKHGRDWTSEPQATVDAPVTTYTVADLAPGSYWGRVAAVNRVGVGSAWVFQFRVRNLLVLPGLDWFEATWPDTPGAAKFVVEYKLQSASDWESAPDVAAGRTSKTVTGLEVGSKYSIRVSAFDDSDVRLWQFSDSAALGSIVPPDLTLSGFHNDLLYELAATPYPLEFDHSPVRRYRVQWRTADQTYNSDRQQDFGTRGGKSSRVVYGRFVAETTYTVRVLPLDINRRPLGAVESSVRILPAAEFWEENVVKIYESDHPWLRQAWDEKLSVTVEPTWWSNPKVAQYAYERVRLTENGATWTNLTKGTGFSLGPVWSQHPKYPYQLVAVHELAHHFVGDYRVAQKPGPVAAGWMFFEASTSGDCNIFEIYAVIAAYVTLKFVRDDPWTYTPVGASACSPVGYPPSAKSQAVVKSAIKGEMPQWLYDTYSTDGTSDGLDLDQLWADIEETSIYDPSYDHLVLVISPSQIAYGFRDSFGGFCSHAEAVRLLADDEASDLNPWVDGGCDTRRPRALEAAPGSNPGEIDIGWQRPFYQALPGISQYIVQWKSGSQSYDASRQATINAVASLSYTISGLTTGNQYSIRIGASNLDAPTVFTDVDGRTRTAETTATAS